MIVHTFKEHAFGPGEKVWLEKVNEHPGLSPQHLKGLVWRDLPTGFSSQRIDPRFYSGHKLTVLGLWHADREHWLFDAIESVVKSVAEIIMADPSVNTLTTAQLAERTGYSSVHVVAALRALGELGDFYSSTFPQSGTDITHIELRHESVAIVP